MIQPLSKSSWTLCTLANYTSSPLLACTPVRLGSQMAFDIVTIMTYMLPNPVFSYLFCPYLTPPLRDVGWAQLTTSPTHSLPGIDSLPGNSTLLVTLSAHFPSSLAPHCKCWHIPGLSSTLFSDLVRLSSWVVSPSPMTVISTCWWLTNVNLWWGPLLEFQTYLSNYHLSSPLKWLASHI